MLNGRAVACFYQLLLLLLACRVCAQAAEASPPLAWATPVAGFGNDYGSGTAVDAQGNSYLSSWHAESATLLTNPIPARALLVSKFDPSGQALWSLMLSNGSNRVYSRLLVDTNQQVLVAAAGETNVSITALDSTGNIVWTQGSGGSRGAAPLMAQGPEGSYALLVPVQGNFSYGTFRVGAGDSDLLVLKASSSGELLWSRRIIGTLATDARGVDVDPEGNVYVAGNYRGALALGPVSTNSLPGGIDGFVAKYDKEGQLLWLRDIRGDGSVQLGGLAVLKDASVAITGVFTNALNLASQKVPGASAFLGRVEADGTFRTLYKLSERIKPAELVLGADGELILAGTFTGTALLGSTALTARGGSDYFLAKLSSTAVIRWAKGFGYVGDETYDGQIALSQAGDIFGALSFRDGLLIDDRFIEGAGASDAALLKFLPPDRPLPTVLEPPRSQDTLVGSSISFSVSATNALRYQWYFGTLQIPGATDASYMIASVNLADAGSYSVAVVNDSGTTRSAPATLTVSGDLSINISTVAGRNGPGMVDSTNRNAVRFNQPAGLALWSAGVIALADSSNQVVRLVDSEGVTVTYAGITNAPGYANGPAALAQFRNPLGLKADPSGDLLIADTDNNVIRRIGSTGFRTVNTIAGRPLRGYRDGRTAVAQFSSPVDLAVDSTGNIFVTDLSNHVVREITTQGFVITFAGSGQPGAADGTGTNASFSFPYGIAMDAEQNLYVTERGNHTVRKITPAAVVSTLAGAAERGLRDGTGSTARFNAPAGVAVDPRGNVYVADQLNHSIRRIDPQGNVITLAGTGAAGFADGTRSEVRFNAPSGILFRTGSLFITDTLNHSLRRLDLLDGPALVNPRLSFRANPATLTIEGNAGVTYQIEKATGDFEWSRAGSVTLISEVGTWSDPDGLAAPMKLYRAVKLP